jgi:hypothetical protein
LDVSLETILNDDHQIFNLSNNHVEKFYIENLTEQKTELLEKTVEMLKDHKEYLKLQNTQLLNLVEKN